MHHNGEVSGCAESVLHNVRSSSRNNLLDKAPDALPRAELIPLDSGEEVRSDSGWEHDMDNRICKGVFGDRFAPEDQIRIRHAH